jgi:hypothetical protein
MHLRAATHLRRRWVAAKSQMQASSQLPATNRRLPLRFPLKI